MNQTVKQGTVGVAMILTAKIGDDRIYPIHQIASAARGAGYCAAGPSAGSA